MTPPPHHGSSFRLVCAGVTDRGKVRSENQDRFGTFPELGLAIVADGMGGAVAGEVAARMAVEEVGAALAAAASKGLPPNASTMAEQLVSAIAGANGRIYAAATSATHMAGMGTTIVAVMIRGKRAAVAHVGDSRLYQFRGGRLAQLTEDHSWLNDVVRAGFAVPGPLENHPRRNIITRAVGPRPEVEVDARIVDVARGDVFLLCSDGLSAVVPRAEVEAVLRRLPDPDEAAISLVKRANELGGPDNITAVVIKCV